MTQALQGGLGEQMDTSGCPGAVRLRAALAAFGLVALVSACGGSSGEGGSSHGYDDGMSGSRTGTGQGSEAMEPRGGGMGGDEGSSNEGGASSDDDDDGGSSGGGGGGGDSGSGGGGSGY